MYILSYEFALLFFVFFCAYWACKNSIKTQNILLIVAGLLYLFSWDWKFVFSLLLMWQTTQISALFINYTESLKLKKLAFITAVLVLVAHLCFFKYSNFFIDELNSNFDLSNGLSPLDLLVPLGLSFYTFQAISYLSDVYQKKMAPMPSALALGFLSFIPTITAGPIFRAKDAMHQWLPESDVVDSGSRPAGIHAMSKRVPANKRTIIMPYLAATLICFALLKKVVFAGWLETTWVNPIFANPLQFNGLEIILGVYSYAFQLFFDFSAYTDLAIAVGLLLGFRLPENFNKPYLATDIRDFWNRWHITLSTWIRDYLYIPLGGNQGSFVRVQFNLLVAFVLSGIWHGAGWNFFLWGLIHATAMIWLNSLRKLGWGAVLTKRAKPLAIFITFNYVCFGWVFFHSKTLDQSLLILKGIFSFNAQEFTLPVLATSIFMIVGYALYAFIKDFRKVFVVLLSKLPWWLLPFFLTAYVMLILVIAPDGLPGFIYSNF